MKKLRLNHVEVDMVPLIDIISLLLMFLIIVGDTTSNSNLASLKLPVASEAKSEGDWCGAGRIVLQVKPQYENENEQCAKNGTYSVLFNAAKHSIDDDSTSLKDHLARFIDEQSSHGFAKKKSDGMWDIPVKLRIPAMCPMSEAEKVLNAVASMQMSDIQYATAANRDSK